MSLANSGLIGSITSVNTRSNTVDLDRDCLDGWALDGAGFPSRDICLGLVGRLAGILCGGFGAA